MIKSSSQSHRHASFFSGIGGFDAGFQSAGIETVSFCEKKGFCREVLRKHWPEVPIFEDVTDVAAAAIPHADIWTAGFPCQDLSLARMGPRNGLRGSQSGLFFAFAELVSKRRPRLLSSKTCTAFSLATEDETSPSYSRRWMNSGMVWHGECLTASISESPNHAVESMLSECIETQEVQEKFFLSQNAATGILRRVDRMKRNLPASFRQSLEILSKGR